jgi:hypothetical protein
MRTQAPYRVKKRVHATNPFTSALSRERAGTILEKTKPQRGRDSAGGRHTARGAGARESLHDVPWTEPLMIMPQQASREARTCFCCAERRDNEGPNKPWDYYKESLSHVGVVLITTLQHTIHNSTTIHYYPLPLPLPLAIHTQPTNQPPTQPIQNAPHGPPLSPHHSHPHRGAPHHPRNPLNRAPQPQDPSPRRRSNAPHQHAPHPEHNHHHHHHDQDDPSPRRPRRHPRRRPCAPPQAQAVHGRQGLGRYAQAQGLADRPTWCQGMF